LWHLLKKKRPCTEKKTKKMQTSCS
jgi:hypothetical protein